jgi:hypothetical protein
MPWPRIIMTGLYYVPFNLVPVRAGYTSLAGNPTYPNSTANIGPSTAFNIPCTNSHYSYKMSSK